MIMLTTSFINAVEFTLDKNSEFDKGETLTGKISGNFIEPIQKENIKFYTRGHVSQELEYDMIRIGGDYYIYALLKNIKSGNYKIAIEGVEYYTTGGVITNENLEKNFTITNSTANFDINPGFKTSQGENFEIKVQNLQGSQITIDINKEVKETSEGSFLWFDDSTSTSNSEGSISLKAGEKKDLKFKVEEPEKTHAEILKLSSSKTSYEIPIYLIADEIQKQEGRIDFQEKEIEVSMSTNNNKTILIKLKNTGDFELKDINLSLSPQLKNVVSLYPENISELEEDETREIFLQIVSGNNEEDYEGQLKAKAHKENSHETYFAYAIIRLEFIKDFIPISNDSDETRNNEESRETVFKRCEDLEDGQICNQSQVCLDGKEVNAIDGVCCKGTCGTPSSGKTQKIVGWIIIVFVLLFVGWFFLKKYRGTQNSFSFSKFMKKGKGKK